MLRCKNYTMDRQKNKESLLMDGKTIKQIADELGVSKQAVWQRVKRSSELSAMLDEHSNSINGTIHVDDTLEQLIKSQYPDRNNTETVDETAVNVDETSVNNTETVDETAVNVDVNALIASLQNSLDTLQQQLTAKDKQIDSLTTMLQQAQERETTLVTALSAAQALHAGTIQERLTTPYQDESDVMEVSEQEPKKNKKGFFARFFGRKGK